MNFKIEKIVVKPDPDSGKISSKEISYYVCDIHYTHIMALKPKIATCPYCDGTKEYVPQRYNGLEE